MPVDTGVSMSLEGLDLLRAGAGAGHVEVQDEVQDGHDSDHGVQIGVDDAAESDEQEDQRCCHQE